MYPDGPPITPEIDQPIPYELGPQSVTALPEDQLVALIAAARIIGEAIAGRLVTQTQAVTWARDLVEQVQQ